MAPPRRKKQPTWEVGASQKQSQEMASQSVEEQVPALSVKDRIRQMERDGSQSESSNTKQQQQKHVVKQKPTNKAFELFEKKGLVIGPVSYWVYM